jgi:hypothetical protein
VVCPRRRGRQCGDVGRIVLRGEKAGNYLDYARVLEENIPISMKKMACAMEAAQAEATKLGGQISPNV